MGTLIQTKGTQRLANLFNSRFDDSGTGLGMARDPARVASATGSLLDAFNDTTLTQPLLLKISDAFTAQHAGAGSWPADLNDFLYPSATMISTAAGANTNILHFTLPAGFAAIPNSCLIAAGSSVCSLDARTTKTFPKGTVVANNGVSALGGASGRDFTVTLSGNVSTVAVGEKISFAKPKHQHLVRRWRWYLANDLDPGNHTAMRNAVSNALNDSSFVKITFQTIEDVQKVLATPRSSLQNDELGDDMIMDIVLLTQSTTSPDKLDPQ